MGKEVVFNIKVTMSERWVNQFCSFLKKMESNGNLGQSESIAFYSDGDGDFRPKFEIGTEFEIEESTTQSVYQCDMYDAG